MTSHHRPETDPIDLDATIRVDRIPREGRDLAIAADAEALQALTARLNVSEVSEFAGEVVATTFRGGIRVKGRVHGVVVQPCVVTGDPVRQAIDEPVDRIFMPGREAVPDASGAEVFVNLGDDDLPDYFEGDEIDVADVLIETFALAIDLYPRAPGAELPDGRAGDDPAETSPFAALKGLKPDQ